MTNVAQDRTKKELCSCIRHFRYLVFIDLSKTSHGKFTNHISENRFCCVIHDCPVREDEIHRSANRNLPKLILNNFLR